MDTTVFGLDVVQHKIEYEDTFDTESRLSKVVKKSKYKRHNKYLRNKQHKINSIKNAVISHGDYYDSCNYFNAIKKSETGIYYASRFYLSGCRGFCKKQTSKKVRKCLVGNYGNYKKQFDYWNTLF